MCRALNGLPSYNPRQIHEDSSSSVTLSWKLLHYLAPLVCGQTILNISAGWDNVVRDKISRGHSLHGCPRLCHIVLDGHTSLLLHHFNVMLEKHFVKLTDPAVSGWH